MLRPGNRRWLAAATAIALAFVSPPRARADATTSYSTAEQAFEAAFIDSGIGQRGYDENREYAAALYRMPNGRWYATQVIAGNRTSSSIPYSWVPPEAEEIVGAHTHGQPRIPEDPARIYGTDFSQADRRGAIHAYQVSRGKIAAQLLLTSRLEVLQMRIGLGYDPASASIRITARTFQLANLGERLQRTGRPFEGTVTVAQ